MKRGILMLYRKNKILAGIISTLLSLSLLTGCGSTSAEIPTNASSSKASGSGEGSVLRYAVESSPKGLFSPLLSNTTYDNNINNLVLPPWILCFFI